MRLVSLYDNSNRYNLRVTAQHSIQQIAPGVEDAIDALIVALGDHDPSVRGEAVCAIAKKGRKAAKAVPYVLPLAEDEDHDVRRFVAFSVGKIATDSQRIIDVLTLLADDDEPSVRVGAICSFILLGVQPVNNLTFLVKFLSCSDEFVRFLAAWAIGDVGEINQEISVASLEKALESEGSEEVRNTIKQSIANLRI